MLKQEGRLGTIAPGALADLLILDQNPLDDITVLDRPELYLKAVLKEGRIYKNEL
jgi:imidazolonepropionase-like amidohydrolase